MADSQRVIEFLRDIRQGGVASLQVSDEVTQMAGAYAQMCTHTNERLRQCTALLQQGLRSEAIHLAEQQPNLLDLVSQLDLPDPQAWAEFCQNNGLPVPPPLQFDRAAQLNEAYAQEQPLEHLLAQHRLLALARAPIRERLSVMRQIAQVDTGNAQWSRDLREFEAARLKELPATFYNAVKQQDEATIFSLMDEINRQPWQEPPPVDLAKSVAEAYARLQRAAVEQELQKLVEPLRDAYAARSLHECQALLQRWRNTMASAGVTQIAAEMMDEIKPVAAFVNEQTKREDHLRRFDEATRAFKKLLDADAPDTQLEASYSKLKEFNEEISEELVRRYMNRKAGRRQEADRKFKTRLWVISGVAAVGIVGVLLVAYLYMTGSNAGRWAARINEAVARHSKQGLDEAQSSVDQLKQSNPGLLTDPKVAAAVNGLLAEQAQYDRDQQRAKDLAGRLATVQDTAQKVLAAPGATMEELRRQADPLDSAMKEAGAVSRDVAWADAQQELPRQVAAATTTWKGLQDRVLTAMRKDLQEISAAVEALPTATSDPTAVARTQAELAGLRTRVAALRTLPLLDEEARKSIAAVEAIIDGRRTQASATGDVAAALQEVRGAATSAAALKKALESFITRFPDDARTADFRRAVDTLNAGTSLEEWLQALRDMGGELRPQSAQAATRRAELVEAFLMAHPDLPIAPAVTAYAEYLHSAADAMADKGTWQNSFTSLLANPLLTDLQVMEVSNGQRYYTLGDVKRTEKRFNNVISISFETIDPKEITKDMSKRLTITIDPPLVVTEKPVPAPHAKAIAELGDDLKTINTTNWETFGIDFADKIAAHAQMDVVVKAILLQQLLKSQLTVAGGVYGVGDAYDRTLSDLTRQNPGEIYWFDASRVTEGNKRALTQIIAAMPAGRTVKERLAAGRVALFAAAAPRTLTAGVVLKNDQNAWTVAPQAAAETGASLWAVVPAANNTTQLRQVGSAAGGKFVLNDAELNKLPQGSIVYALRP